MCGIAGTFNHTKDHRIDRRLIETMISRIRHRGPDESGIYTDDDIALGHARLSIIDLAGGQQPLSNEDESVWITYNGEVFNYIELREGLEERGHRFSTTSDTEVIVHLYEEKGVDCINDLNGQFAFAIWDKKRKQLVLARDRVGIRPLYYTFVDGSLLFASEVKALFADPRVRAEIDPVGLDQFFTSWATVPPRTTFKNISELPPGHFLIATGGNVFVKRYWDMRFPESAERALTSKQDEERAAGELLDLLRNSIKIRLRADVPVAAYLSGGLDSSFITALVKKYYNSGLETFSVAFSDADFDEGPYQRRMAEFLGTRHHTITCGYSDIGRIMPDVVWHAEKPLVRTAPAPLFQLSKLVRDSGIKVVLTGEGSDEILGGYDLFREMKIRLFWSRFPDSKMRPLLLRKLYSYLPNWPTRTASFLEGFYRKRLLETGERCYSHLPRWDTTSRIKSLFSETLKSNLSGHDSIGDIEETLPLAFDSWEPLAQAQYIETSTLLSGNLLSSQGDRMMMANAVEGRFPFLDYRVIEFCAALPPQFKLKVMNEKYILKQAARPYVPEEILKRPKQGYRSPESTSFFNGEPLEYVEELLSEDSLKKTGYFDPAAVSNLVRKLKTANPATVSAKDNMAIVGIITTQLLDHQFVQGKSCQPSAISPQPGANV